MFTRREFLKKTAAAGCALGLGLGGYVWQVEPHWVELVRRPLPFPGLSGELNGASLVQLSDLHLGPRVDDGYLAAVLHRVSDLRPDIVVVTGDWTSYHPGVAAHAAEVFRNFPLGRLATLGILGNHDYGPRWGHPEMADELVAVLESCGVRILRNETVEIEGLQIAGLDDLWARRFDLPAALLPIERGAPMLALSHNPDTADLPGWDKFSGWILSGHTHGGQCRPPFLPPPILPVKNHRYTAGEFELPGNRRIYINRGVGHLLQVRFNVRPELTVFELEKA